MIPPPENCSGCQHENTAAVLGTLEGSLTAEEAYL